MMNTKQNEGSDTYTQHKLKIRNRHTNLSTLTSSRQKAGAGQEFYNL